MPSSTTPASATSGPDELRAPHREDRAELRRLDQPDRIHDDDRRQRRLRHQPDQRRQQQHRHQRGRRRDQLRQLACARRPAGSLRSASCRRRPAWRRAARRPRWRGRSPAAPGSAAAAAPRCCANARPAAMVSVKLISAMPSGRRPQLRDQREVRQRQRTATRSGPGRPSPRRAPAGRAGHAGDPGGHRDQRRRRARQRSARSPTSSAIMHGAHRQRSTTEVCGRPCSDGQDVVEERALVEMHAEQLRDLIDHDDQPDARP